MTDHNRDYTKEEIQQTLQIIKGCVSCNSFMISLNRDKNSNFMEEYNLTIERAKRIILEIEVEDFCYSMHNEHIGFEDEILYVFAPQKNLYNIEGNLENVIIYAKFNILDKNSGKYTIVISFHRAENLIDYAFR